MQETTEDEIKKMIRIKLSSKINYMDLQEEYLGKIVKCIEFDEKDVLENTKNLKSGKSISAAKKLKTHYPSLHRFLFDEANNVKRENLRRLLAGPRDMPESFGGNGESFKTMRKSFDDIIVQCPMPESNTKRMKAKEVCKDIFSYGKLIRKKQDTYWLLRKLNVRVCPYCNRIYTITLPSELELEKDEAFMTTRPAFDHFFSKDNYPYLAVSLFNLIPSCHVCNMNKGNSLKETVYPYDEEFGDNAVFRVIPDLTRKAYMQDKGVLNFLHGESDQFQIKFMGKNEISLLDNAPLEYRLGEIEDKEYRKRIENSIELFRLERLYKEHKEEIRDILRKKYYFNEEYVKSAICPIIEEKMRREEGKENLDGRQIREIAMDMLYFTYIQQAEWGKRPLAKLIADILEQLSTT